MKTATKVGLLLVLAGVSGFGLSQKLSARNYKGLGDVKAKITSREQFVKDRVMETEGTLESYDKFLESKEKYSVFDREYRDNTEIEELKQRVQTHQSMQGVYFGGFTFSLASMFMGGVVLKDSIYGVIKKRVSE